MPKLQALILDIDGTLAETELHGHLAATNRAFAEFGLDWRWTPELYGELLAVTGTRERIVHYVENYQPDFTPPNAPLNDFAARLKARKTEIFVAMVAKEPLPLRPGIRRLVGEARDAGIRLAIATTTSPENVDSLLVNSLDPGAPGWFDVIGAGDVVARKKPAPDIYNFVLDGLALAPEDCLAIEDSRNGLLSARGAGVPVLIAVSDYSRGEDFDGALAVFDHLGDPGNPCRSLNGRDLDAEFIDIELLRTLLPAHPL